MTATAELSSLSTGLDDLVGRITRIADSLGASERESVGADLYEVERTLRNAQRRLRKVIEQATG